MRLEQRRVLNADFTFAAQGGLSLIDVDGDLVVREVHDRVEFDLAGSMWQDVGSDGAFSIDNSVADHSILSIASSDLHGLTSGVLIAADPAAAHRLTFDTQTTALNLQIVAGPLVVHDFSDVQQIGSHDLAVNDLVLNAGSTIELQHVRGDDLTFSASEIHFTGGTHSILANTLAVQSVSGVAIELGGTTDHANVLDFTHSDLDALASGFQIVSFEAGDGTANAALTVHTTGADFSHALTTAADPSSHEAGSLRLAADVVHIDGTLTTSGGSIEVTANLEASVSEHGGLVSHGGRIEIDAGESGTLLVAGRVDVSDPDLGGQGGSVHLFGDQVGLFGGARIDATGAAGGGDVLIGGDLHGANDAIRNSSDVFIGQNVVIDADAVQHGDGGRVIVWSDDATQFFGSITAHGGAFGGDGGMIETSSQRQLILSGGGDASATNGDAGTWLLDPFNVVIVDVLSILGIDDSGRLPNFTPSASGSEITDDAIETQLNAGTNVVISTANSAGAEAGNVTQAAAATINVVFANPGDSATFTINAANDVVLNGGITVSNGTLHVALNANATADDLDLNSGDVDINAAISTNGGTFRSSGVNFDSSDGAIAATGGANLIHTGAVTLGAVSTGSGTILVTAGGNITDNGIVSAAGNARFTTSQANAEIELDLLQLTGPLSLNTLGANGHATLTNAAGIEFFETNIGGNLAATSISGNITNADMLNVAGNANFRVDGVGNIEFESGGTVNFGSLTFDLAGTVNIVEDSSTALSGNSKALSLNLQSSDGISSDNNANVAIIDGTSFNAASINLGNSVGDSMNFGTMTFTASGDVSISENSDLQLRGLNTAANLNLRSSGDILDDDTVNLTVLNNAAFSAQAITLNDLYQFGSLTFDADGAVAITEASAMTLSGNNTAGSLMLSSAGAIANDGTATVMVDGNASFTGTSIALGEQAGNTVHFGTLTFVSAGNVRIDEDSATVLTGMSSAINLDLQSADTLSNDATARLTIDDNATVVAASITLGDQSGDVMNFGTLTFAAAGSVSISEDSGTVVSGLSSAQSLVLRSRESILDDGTSNVTIDNTASFVATSLLLDDVLRFGSLTFTVDGAAVVVEADATVVTGTSTALSLNLTSGDSITNSVGARIAIENQASFRGTSLTLGDQFADDLNFGSLSVMSPGDVLVAEDSDTTLSGTSTVANLQLRSAAAIGNDGTAFVTVTGNAAFDGTSIDIGNQAGDAVSFGTLTFRGDGAADIATDSATVLRGTSAATRLILASDDSISDDGTANVTIDGNAAISGTSITLDDAYQFGSLTFLSTGAVVVEESDGIMLSDTSFAFRLTLNSGDGITDDGTADVVVLEHAEFNGTNISLGDDYRFGSLRFNSPGTVEITELDATSLSGGSSALNLILISADSIGADATGTLNVTETANLEGFSGTVILSNANDFGGTVTLSSGDASTLNDVNSLILGDATVDGLLTLAVADSIVLDGVIEAAAARLDAAAGSISGAGTLTATLIDLDAVAGIVGSTPDDSLTISATTISADNAGAFDVRLSNDNVLDSTVTSLTTVGGNLLFAQSGFGAVTFSGAITSGDSASGTPFLGGDITLTSSAELTVTASLVPLSSEAGTGGSLSISGATILRAINVGNGNITINAQGENLVLAGDVTVSAPVELSAAGDIVIASTIIAAGADSDLTITSDADFDGVGGFWLNESAATDARLEAGHDISIQGSNLIATLDSDDGIRIDADGDVQQVVAGRDLTLATSVGAAFGSAGDVVIDGRQTAGDGSIVVSSNNETLIGANQIAGADLLVQSAARLTNNVTLTAAGEVRFDGPFDDDGSSSTGSALTIRSGGEVVFAGAVGSNLGDRLDTMTILEAGSVEFQSVVMIDGNIDITTQTGGVTSGTVTFAADVTTTSGLASGNVEITNAGILVIQPGADLVLAGAFVQNGIEAAELGANITTLNGGVRFERAVLLTESVAIDTTNRSGDIVFLGTIDSEAGEHNSLMLSSRNGGSFFNGDIGFGFLDDQRLGRLSVVSAGIVVFGGADAGGNGTPGPVTAIVTDDVIDIGIDGNVIAGGIVFNAGSGSLRITTTDDEIRLNGPVVLGSALEIITNASGTGGTVTFTSSATIDSQFGEANDLTIDVGTQRVLFNNDIGLNNALGTFTIVRADNGVVFGQTDANQGPGSTGPVTFLATEGPIDVSVDANVVLGGIVFNAGGGTLQISAADQTVRLNGAITLASNLNITTNTGGEGGTVTFTSAATINSQDGEHRNLTIDAGRHQVLFNNDLGASAALGSLTITQADDGVIFGESGTDQGPGKTGPVTIISTDGPIDVGVEEKVVTGGIALNAGSDTLQITTTDDSVRFNGPVTLATSVVIDTNSSGIGGTVTFTNAASIDSQTNEHNDLTIDAGTLEVQFNNNLGEFEPLGQLTIIQADAGITFGQPVTFGGSDVDQSPGTSGPVTMIRTDGAIDLGVGSNVVTGGIVFNAGIGMLEITTTDDTVRLNGPVTLATGVSINTNATGFGGTITFTSAATIDSQADEHNDVVIDAGSQQVLFNNDLGTTQSLGVFTIIQADGGVFFGEDDFTQGPGTIGPVAIIATDGPIDVGVGINVIAGAGIVFNAGDLTLQISTTDDSLRLNGQVTMRSSLNIDTNSTGDGGTVTFTSAATIDGEFGEANNLTIDAGTKQVLFNNNIGENDSIGALTITQADGGVIFGEADDDQGPGTIGPVTIVATEGAIDIGVDQNAIIGGIVLNGGASSLRMTTTDDPVRFNGSVTLASFVEINSNLTPLTGGGTVTFTSFATIDSAADEFNDLVIDAGSQQVLFNNDLGALQPLGTLTVTQADGGVIFGQSDTVLVPELTGPVAIVASDGPIDIGVGANVVTGGIVLNAGSGTMSITTTDDPVRFNGPVIMATDVSIDTNVTLVTGGGTVTFTSAATIDSQSGEHNDLIIDAGSEQVLFNNSLGAADALGALTITQADSGVIFGQSDVDEGPGTIGPVTIIATDEAIDIGVDESGSGEENNIITFGIVFNAGLDQFANPRTLLLTTTDDTVRLNGPVTLATDIDINTVDPNSLAASPGGTVTFTSASTVDSQADEHNDLTINVGAQQVLFNADLGAVFPLGAFTIIRADEVIFGQADTEDAPGTTGPVTTISTDEPIDIGVGENVITNGIVFNPGTESLFVMTADDTVRFNGAVTLAGHLDINTNPSVIGLGASVTFTSAATIDSDDDEFNDLTIDAGREQVLFNANLGAVQPLGAFAITQADGGVIFGETDTDEGPGSTGPVGIVATDGAIDIGTVGHIVAGGIVFNGGELALLSITTTDDDIRINGPATLASHVEIDTDPDDPGLGGTILFTSASTIDSEATESNDLSIDAGANRVLFNHNLGAIQPLGVFTIVEAGGGVAFGETSTDLGPGTTGPVEYVIADGRIDIGFDGNLIAGGILLDGVAGLTALVAEIPLAAVAPLTITVPSTASFPTVGSFILRIDEEDFIASVASPTELAITARGQRGTEIVRHLAGATVAQVTLADTTLTSFTIQSNFDHIRFNGPTNALVDVFIRAALGIELTNDTNIRTTDHNIELLGDIDDTRVIGADDLTMGFETFIDAGNAYILVSAAEVLLGSLISTSTYSTVDATPAIHVIATAGLIRDVNEDFLNLDANEPGAGVILDAVLGIGFSDEVEDSDEFTPEGRIANSRRNALETEIDTLQARNLDADTGLAEGNIKIVEVPTGGDLNLIDTRNDADPLFSGDTFNGAIIVTVLDDDTGETHNLAVLDDGLGGIDDVAMPYGLLAELKDDPALPIFADDIVGVRSENIIRLTANDLLIDDDLLAIMDDDSIAGGDLFFGTIELNARKDFTLSENRVVSTDEIYFGSLNIDTRAIRIPTVAGDIEAFQGDQITITADFDRNSAAEGRVLLGTDSTISTDSGIAQRISDRPAPLRDTAAFYIFDSIDTSDLDSSRFVGTEEMFLGTMTLIIGVPGEQNLIIDIDWGDRTPTPQDPTLHNRTADVDAGRIDEMMFVFRELRTSADYVQLAEPVRSGDVYSFNQVTDRLATRFLIPEGGLTYVIPHEYTNTALNSPIGQPGRDQPSDPFQIRFAVSQHPSILIEGRAIFTADGASLEEVPLSYPLPPHTEALATLSSTDVRDEIIPLLPRYDNGVARFVIPTSRFSSFIPVREPIAEVVERPKAVFQEAFVSVSSQLTTESANAAALSSSVTTDEFFELRRFNEDGTVTTERLNQFQGEGLLEAERFERFIRDRGDGEYEIWFVTRETGSGAMIERPVIRFRLESGFVAPVTNDSPKLFRPYRLIPLADMANDDMSSSDESDESADDPATSEQDVESQSASFEDSPQRCSPIDLDQTRSSEVVVPRLQRDVSSPQESEEHTHTDESLSESTSSAATWLAPGMLAYAGSRQWVKRSETANPRAFSRASRLARQLFSASRDQ